MNAKEEPMWRVMVSFFLIAAVHLVVSVLMIGSMLGIPYLLAHHWGEVSGYVCGTSCGRAGGVMLKVYAVLMWSISTSVALMAGAMLGVVFKKRVEYIKQRIEEFLPEKEDRFF